MSFESTIGHTATEIIFTKVNSKKENLTLTNFKGNYLTRKETEMLKTI